MPTAVPFSFVVDALAPLPVRVAPFFGGHMIYLIVPQGERMLFFLYDRPRWGGARGVWLATEPEFLARLEQEYPLGPVPIDEFTVKGWRMVAADHPSFETTVLDWVRRLHQGDQGLGRMAPPRKGRKRPSAASPESF